MASWSGEQPRGPSRLWGSTRSHRFGGEERVDGTAEHWHKGEYWNIDSNISVWGEHEIKRNAAESSHDVHRHDQARRLMITPQPNAPKQEPRQCISGVVTADSCFLEAWGFDLGLRDRQAHPAPLWHPPSSGEMFRSVRSFNRNVGRMAERTRQATQPMKLSKSASSPGDSVLVLEDVSGEMEESEPLSEQVLHNGRTHGSRSCHYWDTWGHTVKREGAKLARSVFTPSQSSHPQGWVIKDNVELSPASVYSLKFRKSGESSLRSHVTASSRETLHGFQRAGLSASTAWLDEGGPGQTLRAA